MITIIAESPDDLKTASLWKLQSFLATAGIDINKCYVTVFNKSMSKPSKSQMDFYKEILLKELLLRNEQTIYLLLGNSALWALTGTMDLTKRRGAPIICFDGKIAIPSYLPKETFKLDNLSPILMLDILRLKQAHDLLRKGEDLIPKRELIINPNGLDVIIDNFIKEKLPLSFDIETNVKTNQVICISLSNNINVSYSIMMDNPTNVHRVNTVLSNPLIPKIGQNFLYDSLMLEYALGIRVTGHYCDTMILHHILEPELPHNLGFIASQYTWEPYYKDEIKKKNMHDFQRYNAKDSCVTLECYEKMLALLKEDEILYKFFFDRTMRQWPMLYDMTLKGIAIDKNAQALALQSLQSKLNQHQRNIDGFAGYELIDSNKSLSKLFIEKYNIKPIKSKKPPYNNTFDEDAINKLAIKYPALIWDDIIQSRKTRKLISTYVNMKLDHDQRCRTIYSQTTKTGRLSSRKTPWGTGMNLQNIPRPTTDGGICRNLFVADQDRVFIEADYMQCEVRIAAYQSNCIAMIKIFESGNDIHREVASLIYQKAPDIITKAERDLAKRCVHACWDDETEVLTAAGWVKSRLLLANIEVAQWNQKTRTVSYAIPISYHYYPYDGNLLHFTNDSLDQKVTTNHKMIYTMDQSIYQTCFAFEITPEMQLPLINNKFTSGLSYKRVPYSGYVYCLSMPDGFLPIRRNGKISITGNSNYGMGPRKLSEIACVNYDTARKAMSGYFASFPEILSNRKAIENKLAFDRTLTNCFGRKRMFYGRLDDATIREALAFGPQSSMADLTNESLFSAWAAGLDVCMQIHDAIVIQSKVGKAQEDAYKLKSIMEKSFIINNHEIFIPVDIKTGTAWGDLKSFGG